MSSVGPSPLGARGGVLLLAPGIVPAGGIQTYLRQLLAILREYADAQDIALHCLSLADSSSTAADPIRVVGCRGRKHAFVLRALQTASRQRPTLAIVGHLRLAPVAWALTKARLIRSYVVVIYGIEAWRRLKGIDGGAARAARGIVAVSRHTARCFVEANDGTATRITVIPAAAGLGDPGLIEPDSDADRPLQVLTVSRLASGDRYKGIDTLLEAVRRVGDTGAGIKLTIVGDGDDSSRLVCLAEQLRLGDRVQFAGAVPTEQLEALYRSCDVFAMPSGMEGLGIVFLEAMRYGKACIGGNHGGTPEVIDDGVDGYLVEHGDVPGLAAALARLGRDPTLRREMGARALTKARSKYGFRQMREAWLSLLAEMMSPDPARK